MTENTSEDRNEESNVEKRARWEAFEFRVPCEGTVRVENVSYDESDDHTHMVTVEHGYAVRCTCPYSEYNESCKHMVAVDERPAVLAAATPAVDIEPTGTIDDVLPEANEDDSETNDTERVTDGTQETGPQDDCEDCIQGHACYEHWDQNQEEDTTETETATGTNQPVMADGGQPLTKLENGQIFEDEEGIQWKIDQRVEQVPTPNGPERRTRLVAVESGEVKKPKPHPRDFVEDVEDGTYTLVSEVSE